MAKEEMDSKLRSNYKYRSKTFKMVNVKLRLEEDADIIESMETAKENGWTYREWIRSLYDRTK